MNGPDMLVRSLTATKIVDAFGNVWQYHPQSDQHSKIASWGILFDLLNESSLMRQHVGDGKVIFGVNHQMSDFKTNRKKNLDLVIARPGTPARGRTPADFALLAAQYGIVLTAEQSLILKKLPPLKGGPVGSVLLALEAKAAMTEHTKARPRLYDELNSSHLTIHGAAEQAIAAGLVVVNASSTFISPGRNKRKVAPSKRMVTDHKQPGAALGVIAKVREMHRRTRAQEDGFDAIGIIVIDAKNDGSPIRLLNVPPALALGDDYHYDQMIRRIRQKYEVIFANI